MTQPTPDMEKMRQLSSAFERNRALCGEVLDDVVRSTYLYALRLAATKTLRTRTGDTLTLLDELSAYRQWLGERMAEIASEGWSLHGDEAASGPGTRAWQGVWHRPKLLDFYPTLAKKLRDTLLQIMSHHPSLDPASIEDALAHKTLALALGGGGGTGFVHQALFQLLETHHIRPSLMTGTSMGALMGFFRAMQVDYDAAMSVLHMPGWLTLTRYISPCIGNTRHGLPSFCRFHFSRMLESIVPHFGWTNVPRFSELKIPFASITSGILRDHDVIETIAPKHAGIFSSIFNMTNLTWKAACSHATQIAHALTTTHSVIEVPMGFDALTRDLNASDGIAFSALVPGVINYEIPASHVQSRKIIDNVFERDKLYRCVDGGLTSNVPVRALRREIDTLKHGHTNVHIIGIDVFAPQLNDGVFYPLEQIANANADIDAYYADAFVRLKHLLSPMNLSPSLKQFKWLNHHFEMEFKNELEIIKYVMAPLRPITKLNIDLFIEEN
ncbi:MAG: patatin-like phospholipase family protein [Proteobacteria bacterium]|nr:patatin-like phospholipase family protein [Pseudomonadota bacterium]